MFKVFLWTDRTVHPISGKEIGDGSQWRCVAIDQESADEQWALLGHGNWHKIYCGEHECRPVECACLHRCEGHHKGYITREGYFSCSRQFGRGAMCGFKCQFDLSRLAKCEQNRIRQLTSSGRALAIEVDSTESVGEVRGYVISFRGVRMICPFPRIYCGMRTTSGPGAISSAT